MLQLQPMRTVVDDLDRNIPARLDVRLARYALLAGAAIASSSPAVAGVITTVLPSPVDLIADPNYAAAFPLEVDFFSGATVFSTLGLGIRGLTAGVLDFFFFGGHSGQTGVAFRYSIGDVIGVTGTASPGNAGPEALTLDDFTSPGLGFIGVDLVFGTSNGYGFVELRGTSVLGFALENNSNTPITVFDVTAATVPEPGTFGLLALGAAGLAAVRRRKNQA